GSIMKRSLMFVWVEIVAAIFDASGVAVNAPMAYRPSVSASTFPVAIVTRFRFASPFSAEMTMREAPSFDQTMLLPPAPRGGGLSSADAACNIEIVRVRETSRHAAWCGVDDEQVRLAIGAEWIAVR